MTSHFLIGSFGPKIGSVNGICHPIDSINILCLVINTGPKDLPLSPRFTPNDFLSRCKFSNVTTRDPMVEFYLLAFPCFPLRKKEHKSYFGNNRTYNFCTSRCVGYCCGSAYDGWSIL